MEFDQDDPLQHTDIVKLSDERHKYTDTQHVRVTAVMYDYNCDIHLRVGEQTFRAHRSVLAAASDYFAAMFGHAMRERSEPAVELCGVSPRGFATMIHYFYKGHATISRTSVGDVLEAARFFHVDWLLAASRHCLVTSLALIRFDMALELADTHCLGDVKGDVFRYIGENFASLVADDQRCAELPFDLLYPLVSDDHYMAVNESIIVDAALRWLSANDNENAEQLLKSLRYSLLEPRELEALPDSVHHTVPSLVDEAHSYQSSRSAQCVHTAARICARGARPLLVLVSAIDEAYEVQYRSTNSDAVVIEDFDTSFMRSTFEHAASAVLGNFLFVAGGYDRHSWCSSNAFYRYDPRTHTWDELASMQHARVSFDLCACPNHLYAVGGVDHGIHDGIEGDKILAVVESYDPLHNVWISITPFPLACFNAAAVADNNGDIYVTGGISDDPEHEVPVTYLHVYTGHCWRRRSDMIMARQNHASVMHEQCLFVCGGYTAASADTANFDLCAICEVYDTQTDQWTQLVDTPTGQLTAAVVFDSLLYMLDMQQCLLHRFNMHTRKLEDTQPCAEHVKALVVLDVALPPDIF